MSQPEAPPTRFVEMLRHIGPGLIITAAIVGSGELIVTPKLGAEVGFTLLWFIILGCLIKVFVQIELGRFAVCHGMTTLEAMNSIPGPRLIVSWLVWLWLLMYVSLIFQIAGIMSGVGRVALLAGFPGSDQLWMVVVASSCAVLLILGRYRLVQGVSTAMVAAFTLFTVLAVVALQWTPYSLNAASIAQGLTFELPPQFTTAFAAFGIIGVGASELIYYPYWCLEKGYARVIGTRDASPAWYERAAGWIRIMRLDAWISMVIYTGATIAFYLLGAAVLHGKGLEVTDDGMVRTLSHMYEETFGAWGLGVFLIGAFMVLYSTAFVATASNARLFADALSVFKVVEYPDEKWRMVGVKVGCVLLPALSVVLYLIWGKPVTLVFVGALAQGLMLPFLAFAAVYFRFRRIERRLQPGRLWTFFLVLAAVCMTTVGIYQVVLQVRESAPTQPPTPVQVAPAEANGAE